jgi:ABC-type antimicrobial peptide transport system permease subunit
MKRAVAGVLLGIAGALAAAHVLQTFLFETSATDRAALVIATLVLVSIALLACWVPAWRASRIDPAAVLRDS